MQNKAHALAAGAFVLAVTALLIGLAMWLLRDVANTTTYEMLTADAVTGLQPQAAVRFKGVAVGKVTDIRLDAADRNKVLVRIAVTPQTPITKTTYAMLTFQGVTGLSFVLLDDPGGSAEPPERGPNGYPRIPLRDSALGMLTERAGVLMDKLDAAADRVSQLLGPENQAALTRALTEIGASAQHAGQLAETANQTLRAQLDPARVNVPALVNQAGQTLRSIQAAAAQTEQTLANLNLATESVKQSLGPGGVIERVSESANTVATTTLPRIQTLTEDASRTIRRFDRIADAISDNPQAFIYGPGTAPPGPGEPGFTAPAEAAQP